MLLDICGGNVGGVFFNFILVNMLYDIFGGNVGGDIFDFILIGVIFNIVVCGIGVLNV